MSKIRMAFLHMRAAEGLLKQELKDFPINNDMQKIQKVMFETCINLLDKAVEELREWIEDNLKPEEGW